MYDDIVWYFQERRSQKSANLREGMNINVPHFEDIDSHIDDNDNKSNESSADSTRSANGDPVTSQQSRDLRLAKAFFQFLIQGAINAALSTLTIVTLFSVVKRSGYLHVYGVIVAAGDLSVFMASIFIWYIPVKFRAGNCNAKLYISYLAIVSGSLSLLSWILYLLATAGVSTEPGQFIVMIVLSRVLQGLSCIKQSVPLELIAAAPRLFLNRENHNASGRPGGRVMIPNNSAIREVISTDFSFYIPRTWLGPLIGLLLALAPTPPNFHFLTGHIWVNRVFNSFTAPAWFGLGASALNLAFGLPKNLTRVLQHQPEVASTPDIQTALHAPDLLSRLEGNGTGQIQMLASLEQPDALNSTSAVVAPVVPAIAPDAVSYFDEYVMVMQDTQHSATCNDDETVINENMSNLSPQEILFIISDFCYQFCFWGIFWQLPAWYQQPMEYQLSAFNIYSPVFIGAAIGRLQPLRLLNEHIFAACLPGNIMDPGKMLYISSAVGCTFLIVVCFLFASQGMVLLRPSQKFVFACGILLGLATDCYSSMTSILSNYAYTLKRREFIRRIQFYAIINTLGRLFGVLLLGQTIVSSYDSPVEARIASIHSASFVCIGLTLFNFGIITCASTKQVYSTSESKNLRKVPFSYILSNSSYEVNIR